MGHRSAQDPSVWDGLRPFYKDSQKCTTVPGKMLSTRLEMTKGRSQSCIGVEPRRFNRKAVTLN